MSRTIKAWIKTRHLKNEVNVSIFWYVVTGAPGSPDTDNYNPETLLNVRYEDLFEKT